MTDPYRRLAAALLPVALSACTGAGPTPGHSAHSGAATPTGGQACLAVASAAACPDPATLTPADLIGGCGSAILSIDGPGGPGSDPTGGGTDSGQAWCCYPVHQTAATCDYGRPYVVDGEPRVAAVTAGPDWPGAPCPDAALPEGAREALAAAWLDAALDEHAAVAAFAQVALELVGFGAPPDLVDDTLRAGRDEIGHARLGFALASRYAGAPRSPGRLALSPHAPSTDLAAFAAATAREGCVGETITALLAAESRAQATDPAVLAALAVIAAEEEQHAALAWRTVAWAVRAGGEQVRAAVAEVFAEVARTGVPVPARVAAGPHAARMVEHGVPDAALARRVLDRALGEVVLPAAAVLVGRSARAEPEEVAWRT